VPDSYGVEGTYRMIPIAKNQVMVRFENLADRFDSHTKDTSYVNLTEFASNLYKDVNGEEKMPQDL